MKIRTTLLHLTTAGVLSFQFALAQLEPPTARIASVYLDPESVTVLHLRAGYVTSVRLPEPVNAVVLGDPGRFKSEHSEAEPHLVFFKPTGTKSASSNALITTRTGRAISLSLVSDANSERATEVDYILEYQRPHSFLIEPVRSTFLIAETKGVAAEEAPARKPETAAANIPEKSAAVPPFGDAHWVGKQLRIAVGDITESGQEMRVAFSVENASSRTIELLPPQIQLSGIARQKHTKNIKAEPVAIKEYRMSSRRLAPGASAEGVVRFDRPAFKEAKERLLLEIAQVEEVDRPTLAPIAFVSPVRGGLK
jgi:hypothetical protein